MCRYPDCSDAVWGVAWRNKYPSKHALFTHELTHLGVEDRRCWAYDVRGSQEWYRKHVTKSGQGRMRPCFLGSGVGWGMGIGGVMVGAKVGVVIVAEARVGAKGGVRGGAEFEAKFVVAILMYLGGHWCHSVLASPGWRTLQ